MQKTNPDHYKVGVRAMEKKEKDDRDKCWSKNEHDLVYTSLNIKCIKTFFTHFKMKANGMMCSNSNLHEYRNTSIWGLGQARSSLLSLFYNEMDKFLKLFKKGTKTDSARWKQNRHIIVDHILVHLKMSYQGRAYPCVGILYVAVELHGPVEKYWWLSMSQLP